MKHTWVVRRQCQAVPDGERRWDLAYQSILLWAVAVHQEPQSEPVDAPKAERDTDHANRNLCTGLHTATSSEPER